jgi:hypothetical protein
LCPPSRNFHKFTIGDRIEIAALDVPDALIEVAYTKHGTQQLCCDAWHKLFGKRPRSEIWTRPMIGRRIDAVSRSKASLLKF